MNLPKEINPAPNAPDDLKATPDHLLTKVALGLALLTFLIYLPVVGYTFVNYDDDVFVTNNPMVAPGFTWAGVKWAFTSADIDYWRPLSWLSHMLDMEMFGPVGGLHHLSNLLIHIAASVMLLVALYRLTRTLWPSAVVAALFAWHPLHVESVAWVAERKDVLCGFFWFFTIWAYARYVEKPQSARYALVLLGFILGVMSKPMIVTLPFVLVLLDFWPLRRIDPAKIVFWQNASWRTELAVGWALIKEKLPLFAIVLALSLSTLTSQREVGTMTENIPLFARLVHASLGYTTYLRQTFWPVDLCILYPLAPTPRSWKWAAAMLLCVGLSVRFVFASRRFPFLAVGWLWFIGVLVPVIGLVQVGEQAHADRYTYVSLVGLFLLLVWGTMALAENWCADRRWLQGITAVVLAACVITTRLQTRHWENGVSVFKRAIEVDPSNVTAHNNVASEFMMIGKVAEAIPLLEHALQIRPAYQSEPERRPGMVFNLGLCYWQQGRNVQAQMLISEAFSREKDPKTVIGWVNEFRAAKPPESQLFWLRKMTATGLAAIKDYEGAAAELTEAIRLDPLDGGARVDKAAYLAAAGRTEEALALLQETVKLSPTNVMARSNLGGLLARKGRGDEAITHYLAALDLAPSNPDTRHNYAILLLRNNRPLEAKTEFEAVLRLNPHHLPALQQLAWLLATNSECRDAYRALVLAKMALALKVSAATLDGVAAAAAANGDFEGATQIAAEAMRMAREAKLTELSEAIRARLELYRVNKGYTQPNTITGN